MIVAKYKFDSSIYENLIPVFNNGYNGYTISDEVDSENSNHVIRTIECDTLPTKIQFGETHDNDKSNSLIELIIADTSNIINMSYMLSRCHNLVSIIHPLDTRNATNMQSAFERCDSLTTIDVSNFNTSKVTTMAYMFHDCKNLTSLDVSNFDTSKVTNMSNMFYNCSKLTSLDVSNFDTSNVTTMSSMFAYCYNLTSLDVSRWVTSKVTNIDAMFNFCYLLENVDVSNWDTRNVQYVNGMFGRCRQMTMIDISNFDMNNIDTLDKINYYHMFINIPNVKTLIFGNNKFPDDVDFIELFGLNIEDVYLSSLEKLICPKADYINKIAEYLPDHSATSNPGVIVTNATISDEAMNTISSKNWSIRKMVAQYRYDANTYENLIPEFNAEFSSDKYEIYDSVSEIVIDNMGWEIGGLNGNNGSEIDNGAIHRSRFIQVIPNIRYQTLDAGVNIYLYDYNKQFISVKSYNSNELYIDIPANVRYIRVTQNYQNASRLRYKLITRSIESVNGDLPTRMRFGVATSDISTNRELSLLKVIELNTTELTDCNRMFIACQNVTSINTEGWTLEKVTNMYTMFYACNNLTSLDVSNFNTSNVTDMYAMFYECYNLTALDVSNFNTSNVTNMLGMFNNCQSLISLDLSNFNTSNVTDMRNMFYNCNSLTSLDVSNFNTSEVTKMNAMFNNCNKLTSLDVSNFNTSKVTSMNGMFNGCNNLTSLDVSNWNTSNVTNMNNMFYGCTNLTSLDVSNFNTSKVTSMNGMFHLMPKLKILQLSNWVTNQVIDMYYMFGRIDNMETLDIANWEINDDCNIEKFFYNNQANKLKQIRCNIPKTLELIIPLLLDRTNLEQGKIITNVEVSSETLSILQSKNWTVVSDSILTKVAEYVYNSNTWNSMIPTFNSEFVEYFIDDIEYENGLVTRTISSMGGLPTLMRFGTTWIASSVIDDRNKAKAVISIEKLNISRLTSMCMLFRYCNNVMSINTKDWDTSNVTDMSHMFAYCSNLTQLDISNWDTSNVTSMTEIFRDCQKLTSLDVSNFDTSKVTAMQYMFHNCNNLTLLDLSNFNTSNVIYIENMFHSTSKLSDIGMLYCTPSTINTIASNLPTTHTQTIWVKDTKPNECTVVSGVEFKEYKENGVVVNLNSPLLNGDRIEVVDGKLCHYHKMGKVVLDGSEQWYINNDCQFWTYKISKLTYAYASIIVDNFKNKFIDFQSNLYLTSNIPHYTVSNFKQWLSENPTTVIYELAEPYYEDITPIQSNLTLETYLESNLDIYTKLPIKTNLTYLTNIANTSSIEEEINTINEGTDLTNLLEDEINN